MKRKLLLLSFLCFGILLWAVSAQEHEDHEEENTAALIEQGADVFVRMGCSACHGENGIGTDIAPSLVGHSEFSVLRQLRAPIGDLMPVYSPAMLPAEDARALAVYIASLTPSEEEADHAHDHSSLATGDIVFAHHWLLYLALQEEDINTAIHQIEHMRPYLGSVHLGMMEALILMLEENDFENALLTAESMVADVEVFGEDADFVYVQMIYRALLLEDAEASAYFIEDYLQHAEDENMRLLVEAVQAAVETGDFAAAAAMLELEYGESLLFEEAAHSEAEATEEAHEHEDEEATEETHGH